MTRRNNHNHGASSCLDQPTVWPGEPVLMMLDDLEFQWKRGRLPNLLRAVDLIMLAVLNADSPVKVRMCDIHVFEFNVKKRDAERTKNMFSGERRSDAEVWAPHDDDIILTCFRFISGVFVQEDVTIQWLLTKQRSQRVGQWTRIILSSVIMTPAASLSSPA